jgi:hypothetical protein
MLWNRLWISADRHQRVYVCSYVMCDAAPAGERGAFLEAAMLGSNQRPLPCEVRALLSGVFAVVQKYLQIAYYSLDLVAHVRQCSCGLVYQLV